VTALTDHDRRRIAEARELAGLVTPDATRGRFPGWGDDLLPAYVEAFTTGRYVLGDLAAIAERLGDAEDQAAEDTRRLGEIRALLARFDWEHDDRQLALEAVDRIADGGQA
jgi:hypothetical protein